MFMDLLPICGAYRGVSRNLTLMQTKTRKNWDALFKEYSAYLDWEVKGDFRVCKTGLQLLQKLHQSMAQSGGACEIIFYSDDPTEISAGSSCLGFDVFGDDRESAIQTGNKIDEIF